MNQSTPSSKVAGEGGQPAEELLPFVYRELRRAAAAQFAHESPGQTLNPTALVHEAYLRLARSPGRQFENRTHFFNAAAEVMRRILIDRARHKHAVRHGGTLERANFDGLEVAAATPDDELLAVDEALERLAAQDRIKADLVRLRYFAGFTMGEAADALELSVPTAKRYWKFARAWLYREITEGKGRTEVSGQGNGSSASDRPAPPRRSA